jgi:hypothetical protein
MTDLKVNVSWSNKTIILKSQDRKLKFVTSGWTARICVFYWWSLHLLSFSPRSLQCMPDLYNWIVQCHFSEVMATYRPSSSSCTARRCKLTCNFAVRIASPRPSLPNTPSFTNGDGHFPLLRCSFFLDDFLRNWTPPRLQSYCRVIITDELLLETARFRIALSACP